jgi:acyl carrier protein
MSEVTDTLRGFLNENVLFGEGTVTDDQELIGGVLDSLALLQFVEFIESEYGFEVGDADMVPANFQTLSAVERYISSRS